MHLRTPLVRRHAPHVAPVQNLSHQEWIVVLARHATVWNATPIRAAVQSRVYRVYRARAVPLVPTWR
jgi:hypothetical protein